MYPFFGNYLQCIHPTYSPWKNSTPTYVHSFPHFHFKSTSFTFTVIAYHCGTHLDILRESPLPSKFQLHTRREGEIQIFNSVTSISPESAKGTNGAILWTPVLYALLDGDLFYLLENELSSSPDLETWYRCLCPHFANSYISRTTVRCESERKASKKIHGCRQYTDSS